MTTKKPPPNAWQPGQSGNPAGKPRGARNRATLMIKAILESGAQEVTQAVVDAARAGDLSAARLVLDRLLAPLKERPVTIDMPPTDTAAGIAQAQEKVLSSVACGDLTPSEGETIASLLEARRRALETATLAERIEQLERSLTMKRGNS